MQTEKKRFSIFRKLGTYIDPVSYCIGEREEFGEINSIRTLVHVPVTSQFIPLRYVLTKFFELPGLLDNVLDYLQMLSTNDQIITNLVQADYWKERILTFNEKIVLPLIIYFDDYENNNPLGSHRGISKTGAVYVSIPALPPQYQAKIENIFLFVLFNTLDSQVFKHPIIFARVVEELNFLIEYGIEIKLSSGSKRIYFELVLFVGDNLAFRSILGLGGSFRAKTFCHHCLITQSEKNAVFLENQCTLRTTNNYNDLLALNNEKVIEIKEKCVLHDIHNFHMTKNISVDVMHDLLEGICMYDIAFILENFIYTKKYFTFDALNLRVRGFDFGPGHNVNRPTKITDASSCHLLKCHVLFKI